ncbi:MAG TPA: non-canonical purine NTP pyrophosphatase, partial [Aquamicrobium sp.]|nr:non-canonical purine NTP pyrophosphatase [Aquamicrobium sp.]
GFDRTFGEMTVEEKQGTASAPLSHRARAFDLFRRAMLARG